MTKTRTNADSANEESISGLRLENEAITELKIDDGAVTAAKIDDGAITDSKLTTDSNELVQAGSIEYSYPQRLRFNASAVVPRPTNERLRDIVSVRDFGAVGDGFADDTAAVQAALSYCTYPSDWTSSEWGFTALYFPTGLYKISDSLNISFPLGVTLYGDGPRSTQLVFTGSNKHLFKWRTYWSVTMKDMGLIAADSVIPGSSPPNTEGRPVIVSPSTKDSVAIRFDGTGGGHMFKAENLLFKNWGKCLTTTDNTGNCDNHIYDCCQFLDNITIWDNSNIQAIAWAFNQCRAYYNDGPMFVNPAVSTRFDGGDYINPGTFIKGSQPSTTNEIFVKGIRFENYQNIDPSSAPKFFELSGTTQIFFEDCIAFGGGSLAGKTSGTASGIFEITFKGCQSISGNFELDAGSAFLGIASSITFEDCSDATPTVIQTTPSPFTLNSKYIRHTTGRGKVTRIFHGAIANSQQDALESPEMTDGFRIGVQNSSGTVSQSISTFCPAPYVMGLTGLVLAGKSNNGVACTYDLWTDNTKTSKIATVTTPATSGYFYIEVPYSSLLVKHIVSSSSSMLAELTAPSSTTCRAYVTYKYREFSA